jgi:hypothetical protein
MNNEVNRIALISKSEYACRQSFSKSYVSKLIKQGKVSVCNGLIDEDKANARNDLKRQLPEAKLNNEIYKGQILKAKTDALTREHVSAETVKKAVQAKNRIVMDTLLRFPDRVSASIASLKDASAIHALLTNEFRNALLELSNDT